MSREAERKRAAARNAMTATGFVFFILVCLLLYMAFTGHVGYDDGGQTNGNFLRVSSSGLDAQGQFKASLLELDQKRLAARQRRKDVMRREAEWEVARARSEHVDNSFNRNKNHNDKYAKGKDNGLNGPQDHGEMAPLDEYGLQDMEPEEILNHNPVGLGDEGDSELQRVWREHRENMKQHAELEMGDDDVEPQAGDSGVLDWDNFEPLSGGERERAKSEGRLVEDDVQEREKAIQRAKEQRLERLEQDKIHAQDGDVLSKDNPDAKTGNHHDPNEKQHFGNDENPELNLIPDIERLPEFKDIGGRGAGSEGDETYVKNPSCKVDIKALNAKMPTHEVQTVYGRDYDRCVAKQTEPATFKSKEGKNNRVSWLYVQQPGAAFESVEEALNNLGGSDRNNCLGSSKLQDLIDANTFKFAFVQDPWERFVQTYISESTVSESRLQAEAADDKLAEERLLATIDSLDFDKSGRGIDRGYLPQVLFLSDLEGILLDFDFIGRVGANLQTDFQQVLRHLPADDTVDAPAVSGPRPLQEDLYRDIVEKYVRGHKQAQQRVLQHYKDDCLCFFADKYDEESFV